MSDSLKIYMIVTTVGSVFYEKHNRNTNSQDHIWKKNFVLNFTFDALVEYKTFLLLHCIKKNTSRNCHINFKSEYTLRYKIAVIGTS